MTAWVRHGEDLEVNRKRVYRLIRENGLVLEQVRHIALRGPQRSKPKTIQLNEHWSINMTKFLLVGFLGWCYLIIVLDWYTR